MKKHTKGKAGERLSFASAIEIAQAIILSRAFLEAARKRPQDFTRKRKMPFTDLITFIALS